MVMLSLSLLASVGKHIKKKSFLDKIRVYVKGGNGGQGVARFRGFGGRGGHVFLVGSEKTTLNEVVRKFPSKRITAGAGDHCSQKLIRGHDGKDVEVCVPVGVEVLTDSNQVIGEINEDGQRLLVAMGGDGGSPDTEFQGQKGHALSISLDLKLIADIGLVGYPNAGKSSLLRALSRATPKVANYPFTTLAPQLGILQYKDDRCISMADLPGLIEGAFINKGLGHRFLKHVERTHMLVLLVDVFGFRLDVSYPHRSAFQTVQLLNRELELYDSDLLKKPAILVLNKMDIEGSEEKLEEFMQQYRKPEEHLETLDVVQRPTQFLKFDDILTISAKNRINTDFLKVRLRELLDFHDDEDLQERALQLAQTLRTSLTEHSKEQLI